MTSPQPDDPITLADACELAFHGRVKVATLRAEAARGKLAVFRIGKRDFTTLRSVSEMVEQCRRNPKVQGSISINGGDPGSSATERDSSAQAALKETVRALKPLSKNTEHSNISRFPRRRRV